MEHCLSCSLERVLYDEGLRVLLLSGGPFTGLEGPSGGHWSAMREAFAGMSQNRLPPHLLFTERDFDENDYEALLALDEAVESRKGAKYIPLIAVNEAAI